MKNKQTVSDTAITLTPQEKLRILSRLQVRLRELVAKKEALISKQK